MSEFRNRKWSDQSRGPSAIDAPSHHGFGLYRHFETEHSMLSARFSANNCSEVIRTFSLLDLPLSPRSRKGVDPKGMPITGVLPADSPMACRIQLAFVVDVADIARCLSEAGRTFFGALRTRKTCLNDADRLRKYLARLGTEFFTNSAKPFQLKIAEPGRCPRTADNLSTPREYLYLNETTM